MRLRRVAVVLAALVATGAPAAFPAAAEIATVRETGYLTMEDGVQLHYTVVRPASGAPVPTLFEYSGYSPGIVPDEPYVARFAEGDGSDGGYAYIGVNLRGTGCSDGIFDFFQPQEARDGARVIDWIIHQPWSNGRVGMIGKSYPGITQLFVAAQQPPGLVAITPGHFFADAYRDVARPGGIINKGFATLWSFIGRPSYEVQDGPGVVLGGDLKCVNALTGELRGLPKNPFVQLLQHPWDDALVRERSPLTYVDNIRVPVFTTLAWQDEQLGSRQSHLLTRLRAPWWAILTNGDHGMYRTRPALDELERFLDHFVKGEDNGWEQRPRVEVWWEAGRDGVRAPGWVTSESTWTEADRIAGERLRPWALNLHGDGGLSEDPSTAGDPGASYNYVPVVGSQGIANPSYALPQLPDRWFWDQVPPAGTAAAFTSPALPDDRMLLGSASLDTWMVSTAPDSDLQVTLTEVRPDGQEMYVARGWLRVSQRALDAVRSTVLRPFQTHQQGDASAMSLDSPQLARVEIFPFGHVFRAGSRIRVWVEAPTPLPELWSFLPYPVPARNTILTDAAHPSRLVLPLVPRAGAGVVEPPDCGTVIRQPCRSNPIGAFAAGTIHPQPPPASAVATDPAGSPAPAGPLPATGAGATAAWFGAALVAVALAARRYGATVMS
jgi:uncharacterized protein